MSSGAKLDYDFSTKRHWRRTVWNALLKRLNGRHKREVIIYLAGADDMDRPVALDKGVPNHNLIAVERDRRAFKKLRAEGKPVIYGDLLDVLSEWPDKTPVCAVHADYCSGIEWGNLALYDVLERPALRSAVVALNLQRGRDPWSNHMRKSLEDNLITQFAPDPKHRGWQYLAIHAIDSMATCLTGRTFKDNCDFRSTSSKEARCKSVPMWRGMGSLVQRYITNLEPQFMSYRSKTGVMMDTVIFVHAIGMAIARGFEMTPELEAVWKAEVDEVDIPRNHGLRRSIAAQLAWRTMRCRGSARPAPDCKDHEAKDNRELSAV